MRKIFLIVLLIATTILSVFGLSSCKDDECTHEWGEWSISSPSTCSTQGTKQRKCSKCNEVQTESIDITDHEYNTENLVWTWNGYESATATLSCITDSTHTRQINANVTDEVTTAPTCTATGTKTYTSTVKIDDVTYTAIKTETLAALGHIEVTDAAVAATCQKTGLTEGYHCSVCGMVTVAQKSIDKLPHTEETIVVTAPTCEEQGYTTHTCSICKDSFVDTYVDELGHNWGAWEVSGSYTLRNCINDCNCGKYQHISSIIATYNGIRLLVGESVGKDDVVVTATLSDGTTLTISDFTLENDVMTVDGSNYVDVKFYTMSTKIAVPAIYNNLPGTTSVSEFTYTEEDDAITITGFIGSSTDIIIPAHINRVPVRYIGKYAFNGQENIKSVVIPDSVKAIGNCAFEYCKSMKTLTLGKGLTYIGYSAFKDCLSLPEVFIPASVITIDGMWGYGAFQGCTSLKKATIGEVDAFPAETTIGACAFMDCTVLEEVLIGNNVKSLGMYAFASCIGLSNLSIGSCVQTIGDYAFNSCQVLTSVIIPDSVEYIGNCAFEYCKSMKTLTLGKGLTYIGYSAFKDCLSLPEVFIPASVITIDGMWGYGAFQGCTSLKKATIGEVDAFPAETTIGACAFMDCTALEEVFIGDNVKFISENAFEGCTSLVNFNIGTGVQRIGAYALQNCSSLKSVVIPANVQIIGASLFTNCSSLEEVIIEKGVLREVASDVFNGCSSFDRIYYTGTASDWVLVAVSEDNLYPLNISPYYYSSLSPSGKGNYWYYNSNGEIRVWNVSETSFKAEEYSEKFANSTFGSSNTSYSSQFLSQLEGDSLFQAKILIWEGLHLATGSVWENKLISKKDVYKMVIYDLITGKANSQASPIDGIEEACDSYVYEYAKFLLGSDSITKAELEQLSTLDCDYIEMVDKYFEGIDVLKEVFEMSLNLYDALYVCAQYQAFVDVDENLRFVLTEMANDGSLPRDLRNAARESIEYYDMATENMLQLIALREFTESTLKVCVDHLFDEVWKNLLGSVFPQVEFATLTVKGVMFLADMGFNLDACNEAYYQLETAVGLENALRNVIKNTLPDYFRYNYKDKSEYYMYAIDMYQTSVLLGFDYSNNLLREHSKSADVNAEEKQAYENMMAQISGMKQEKATMYNNIESVIEQLYGAYYS